jgi:hypothetical protein
MKRMASPSVVGVAIATARVDPEAIAATTTGMRVAAAMVYLVQIPSCCRCIHQPTSKIGFDEEDHPTSTKDEEDHSTRRINRLTWISCRKNTGYHAMDPKIRTQGAKRGRSWIATKHGDGSLELSNTQRTAERDAELYPGSGPSW